MVLLRPARIRLNTRVCICLANALVLGCLLFSTESTFGQIVESRLPQGKRTTLGLYLTAADAYNLWKSSPDSVKLIDVRTPEEYAFVGHPDKAWNIPFAFVNYYRKNGKTEYGPRMNPEFIAEVSSVATFDDTLFLICRSGDRSAMAVNALATAGFKKVHNVVDGFEGDKVSDTGSVFYGKRLRNGWKNSAPWVYDIDPEKIILEESNARKSIR